MRRIPGRGRKEGGTVKLSVVIPVYNEREHFEELLQKVRQAPLPAGTDLEILLIDDGSTDGTGARLDTFGDGDKVRVHHLPVNCGKGSAVRTGFRFASGDMVLIQDADLEYDPADYPALLAPLLDGRADVVYGSRFLGDMSGMTRAHVVGNKILTWTSNLLFGGRLTDAYTCYKVMRTETVRGLGLRARDFDLEAEITARVLQRRLRVVEVPIRYLGRTTQEGKKIRKLDGLMGFFALLRYRFLG